MQTEQTGLKRHLKVRHIRLMALGSTIGVGLFLGSASAIQIAGPSILLGYLLAGIVAFIVLRTLGEMAVHEPVAGSFAAYANTYVGPLAGYMVGWGYWTYWIVVGIAEVTAVGLPACFVPFAVGNGEQTRNAQPVVDAGGALLVADRDFDTQWLREHVVPLLHDDEKLTRMSAAARACGRKDAAGLLADLVEKVAQ